MNRAAATLQGWRLPAWSRHQLYLALSSSIKHILPIVAFAALFRIGWRGLGIRLGYVKLTAVLLVLTVLFCHSTWSVECRSRRCSACF
jgi:hypothetical protein